MDITTNPLQHHALRDDAFRLEQLGLHVDRVLCALDDTAGGRPRAWQDQSAMRNATANLLYVAGMLRGAHAVRRATEDDLGTVVAEYALPYLQHSVRELERALASLQEDARGRAETEPALFEEGARFQWAAALQKFCHDYHSGMNSRGYRILSRLSSWNYRPSLADQQLHGVENEPARNLYAHLVANYADTV